MRSKIDSDQLFFPNHSKNIVMPTAPSKKLRINPLEQIAYKLYTSYLHNSKKDKSPKRKWQDWLAIKMVPFYFSYLKKRIKQDKILVSLSGINVLQKKRRMAYFFRRRKDRHNLPGHSMPIQRSARSFLFRGL